MPINRPVKHIVSGAPQEGAEIVVKVGTKFYDETGRFLDQVKKGTLAAFEEMAADGEAKAAELAPPPSGNPDPRSLPIGASFFSEAGETFARWGNTARHALAVEKGTRRHLQTGDVGFFWQREERWWKAGPNEIDHPPTDAKPFLRPSFYYVAEKYKDYLRKHLG